MTETACRQRLTDLLSAHNTRIGAANDYLLSIRNAIAANDLEKLRERLSHPEFEIDAIEQIEQQRHEVLAAFKFDQDSKGFEACIAWCDDEAGQLAALYAQLVENLVQLQHAIQLNNLLINKGRDRLRRSIGILTGLGAGANHKTYSSSGQTEQSLGRRDIAIA